VHKILGEEEYNKGGIEKKTKTFSIVERGKEALRAKSLLYTTKRRLNVGG